MIPCRRVSREAIGHCHIAGVKFNPACALIG